MIISVSLSFPRTHIYFISIHILFFVSSCSPSIRLCVDRVRLSKNTRKKKTKWKHFWSCFEISERGRKSTTKLWLVSVLSRVEVNNFSFFITSWTLFFFLSCFSLILTVFSFNRCYAIGCHKSLALRKRKYPTALKSTLDEWARAQASIHKISFDILLPTWNFAATMTTIQQLRSRQQQLPITKERKKKKEKKRLKWQPKKCQEKEKNSHICQLFIWMNHFVRHNLLRLFVSVCSLFSSSFNLPLDRRMIHEK